MHFTEPRSRPAAGLAAAALVAGLLGGCAVPRPFEPVPSRPPAAEPARPAAPPVVDAKPPPVAVRPPAPVPATPVPAPPAPARNWNEYRIRAAQSIASVNAPLMFKGPVPERLASIPVLEVQLNRDGSIRQIDVLRTPKFSPETVQLAMQAVRRVGNFGPVGHLPQPWRFSETFLYNDDLKFQLHTLVQLQD